MRIRLYAIKKEVVFHKLENNNLFEKHYQNRYVSIDNSPHEHHLNCTNQQPPHRGGAVPGPVGLGRNGCWPSRGSQLPWALPFIFSLCCPLNDRTRAAHSSFKIGRLFSLFLFSCPSLALLRLLILLLLLMSGNVHPNPGPVFPCSVCAGNMTWRGKSVQCCACSQWAHLRCSQLSLSQFRALGSSHSWSCPPAESLWLPLRTPLTCIPSLCNLALPLLTLLSRPTLVSKPLIPHLPILYLLPLPLHHCPLSWLFFCASCPHSPIWLSQGSSMECWRSSSQEH